ncbi:MAG: flagellar protein FlaG, partial [Lachnospiraceae bacterium]|nr:flagellar protein FlaG [Lachnospiraceae bacterium]
VQETQKQPDSNSEKKNDSDSREATDEQIWQAVSEINKRANETEAIFGIHEKTNRITIKIVDKKSKDVIREVPAEKTLDLIAKAWELAGLLVDEKR